MGSRFPLDILASRKTFPGLNLGSLNKSLRNFKAIFFQPLISERWATRRGGRKTKSTRGEREREREREERERERVGRFRPAEDCPPARFAAGQSNEREE